ncbi:hypothetical protein TVNIR_1607 [Thioalkalivibrio nitratireducens DSM 14787]|uniref:Uncharacterized protein n=1 Tax=Thioalkalivibrio nitratireducens (strain DSM 14787 / UNIQEM 213 / ALEN2) TaxID=1255043 RepID=L0DW68_THIND|nr:hypothetical protein TVNIR_1607 [Thioalkalivibrio nitratireducens DSM 14787]
MIGGAAAHVSAPLPASRAWSGLHCAASGSGRSLFGTETDSVRPRFRP